MRGFGGAPLVLQFAELVQLAVVVFAHAARIQIDHLIKFAQLILNVDHLIDLLLILCHDIFRAAMAQNIGHLIGGRVLIDWHRNCTDGLCRNH